MVSETLRYSVVVGLAVLVLHCGDSPTEPSAQARLTTFRFDGVMGLSCFFCGGSDEFGTGVPPGTRLTGTLTFDPNTAPRVVLFDPNTAIYIATIIEFAVGSESVSGNRDGFITVCNGSTFCRNPIFPEPGGDFYNVVGNVFNSGTIAGVNIAQFSWVVSATSSLFSDTSLPLVPFSLAAVEIINSRVCIGDCGLANSTPPADFTGEILEGEITSLTLVP